LLPCCREVNLALAKMAADCGCDGSADLHEQQTDTQTKPEGGVFMPTKTRSASACGVSALLLALEMFAIAIYLLHAKKLAGRLDPNEGMCHSRIA
jgi:hypothetical protein